MSTWVEHSFVGQYSNHSNASLLLHTRNDFGPAASGRFDFTLLFEDTVLSIIPSVLLLLLFPLRWWSLYRQPLKVAWSPIYENKLVWPSMLDLRNTLIGYRSFSPSMQSFNSRFSFCGLCHPPSVPEPPLRLQVYHSSRGWHYAHCPMPSICDPSDHRR